MFSFKTLGLTLFVIGLVLPVITYIGGYLYNVNVASYGGPPNQGAMILAYFALQISLGVGACLALAGLAIALTATGKRMPHA